MRVAFTTAAAALALAAPSAASAQRPFVGASGGYAIPFGDVGDTEIANISTREIISSEVPIEIEAGIKAPPGDAGVYFGYALGRVATEPYTPILCWSDCSANVMRIGAHGDLRFELGPGREVSAGLLVGWERLALAGSQAKLAATGWEVGLQGGFDFTTSTIGVGPFARVTLGNFNHVWRGSEDILLRHQNHGTFEVGIRGTFQL